MPATITVCILLLAKTLFGEGCELSTTLCFASCNLLTGRLHTRDGTNRLAISFLIGKIVDLLLQGDCEDAKFGSLATRSALITAGRASL